jgi:hypothetical protein
VRRNTATSGCIVPRAACTLFVNTYDERERNFQTHPFEHDVLSVSGLLAIELSDELLVLI